MDFQSNEALALFNKSRHEIRGMQVTADDLVPFQKDRKLKLSGTALNAVGAVIQLVAENSDFAVFSSWLSPLIARQVPQNKMYGTIRGHILDACQGATLEVLLAKNLWLFPLVGGDPPHWVLGWIESGPRLYHIFDNMPELNSVSWAEPALLELGDTIYATLGQMEIDWEPWKRVLHAPSELDRQMNSWACGFFVIHAMKALVDGSGIESVTNSETGRIKEETLALIMDNIRYFSQIKLFQPPIPSVHVNDIEMAKADELSLVDRTDAPPNIYEPETLNVVATVGVFDEPPTDMNTEIVVDRDEPSNSKRKIDDHAHENAHDHGPKKLRKVPKKTWTKPADREKILIANEWIRTVEPHRVYCKGCSTWIKLDKKTQFKMEPWECHEGKCPGITGEVRVTGRGSIQSFFGKGKETGSAVKVEIDSESRAENVSDSESEKKSLGVTYITRSVKATPSIATIFDPGPIKSHPRKPVISKPPETRSCQHLSGEEYNEYIERTETRTMGGISPVLRSRVARQVFMYKKLAALKSGKDTPRLRKQVEMDVPEDGNSCLSAADWTEIEHIKLYEALKGYARWEVNYVKKFVRSTRCEGVTSNDDGICDTCNKLANDQSLKHAINRQKNREARLPEEEQHEILMARNKFSSKRFLADEARKLNDQLKDPLIFKSFKLLQKGESTECFIQLYDACLKGKLKKHETFKQLCSVLSDVLEREGTNKKFGVRYPKDYLNFMILLRSYGGQSARQYGIIAGQFPAPSARHLRTLVSKSEDALQNPYLIYENMARVKRLVDRIKYTGPVAVAGDCTKVRKRLTYSTDFGGHILGSVLPFEQSIVENSDDIDTVITKITKAKAEATQVRAILVKIPLPHVPPQVVALIPTDGKDDAHKIIESNLKLLKMSAELSLPVVSFAADGAASELSAQNMFDKLKTDFPPLTYSYPLYGIHLRIPVFETGPAVALQDAHHGSKTGHNQPQAGTHTASLGKGKVVNNDLVQLQRTGTAGLLKSDVLNVDKQDDGPARRMWHHAALLACTIEDENGMTIKPGFEGVFFDAWLNRTMTVANRVLAVLRARFWLHFWREHIVDILLLLVLIYSRHYPDQPFCPWLLGTEFVEHFFGLARMMLPNFTYAEFLKMVQHMAVRQRILLSGRFHEKRERNARVGYVLDFDTSPLTAEDRKLAEVRLTDSDINALVELAFQEASLICTQLLGIAAPKPTREDPVALAPLGAPMRTGKQVVPPGDSDSDWDIDPEDDSEELDDKEVPEPAAGEALCEDYDHAVEEAESDPVVFGPPLPPSLPVTSGVTEPAVSIPFNPRSEIIDGDGKLSIALMVQARLHWQSGTTTRSQKTLRIDSKYAISRISRAAGQDNDEDTEPERMTHQEASQRVRIVQDSNSELQDSQPRKARELRWQNVATQLQKLVNTNGESFSINNSFTKNVHQLNPLSIGSFTLMWNGTRFYIGEILDVPVMSLRVYLALGIVIAPNLDEPDDDRDPNEITAPLFSCHDRSAHLYTHAKIEHLMFHLGRNIFERESHAGAGSEGN
ncbi:hypothetical protein B0H13DRAFT_1912627 [Mycena leptocephala]|nr:hypothetical protein B0H13DRAFT_1912627 [Mycena leptocephala]